MKTKSVRKLQLNRTTLLNLDPARLLAKVRGGIWSDYPCPEGSDPCSDACTDLCTYDPFMCGHG